MVRSVKRVATPASAADAFRAAGTAVLDRAARYPDTIKALDPDAIHRIRVTLRRLDAVFRLFAPIVSAPQYAALARELKWASHELSRAREIDVFLTEGLPLLRGSKTEVVELERLCRKEQKQEYQKVRSMLRTARFKAFIRSARNCVEGRFGLTHHAQQPAADFLAKRLGIMRDKLRHKTVRHLGTRRLHKLRVHAKRMRYAIDSAKKHVPSKHPKRAAKFTRLLARLQVNLGALNDAAAHAEVISRLKDRAQREAGGKAHQMDWPRLLRTFSASQKDARSKNLAKAVKVHGAAMDIKPFWN